MAFTVSLNARYSLNEVYVHHLVMENTFSTGKVSTSLVKLLLCIAVLSFQYLQFKRKRRKDQLSIRKLNKLRWQQ